MVSNGVKIMNKLNLIFITIGLAIVGSYPIRIASRSMIAPDGASPDPGDKEWTYGMAKQADWIMNETIIWFGIAVIGFIACKIVSGMYNKPAP